MFNPQVSVPSPLRSISRLHIIRVDSLDVTNRYSDMSGYFAESNYTLVQCNWKYLKILRNCLWDKYKCSHITSYDIHWNTIPWELHASFTPCIRTKVYSLILPWYDRNLNDQNACHSFCKTCPQIYSVQCNYFITWCYADHVVRFFKLFTIMCSEFAYFRQLTAMSARICSGSLCIHTIFIIVYNC